MIRVSVIRSMMGPDLHLLLQKSLAELKAKRFGLRFLKMLGKGGTQFSRTSTKNGLPSPFLDFLLVIFLILMTFHSSTNIGLLPKTT